MDKLKVGDFVAVIGDSLEAYGLSHGDYLYLAGSSLVPVTENDPYLHRQYFVAAYVDEENHILAEKKPLLIDPFVVERVTEDERVVLHEQYLADFDTDINV